MRAYFDLKQGGLVETGNTQAAIAVYALPDEAEKKQLLETLGHDRHDLESALDPDEVSRIDFGADDTYIIWKRPNNASYQQGLKFEVSSVGFFIQKNQLTVISGDSSPVFSGKEFQRIESINDLLLKFFIHTTRHYLEHLKVIKQLATEVQAKLNLSMENHYLIQTFVLSESLAYYLNAVEANASVLSKLRTGAVKLGFSSKELEELEDAIIENQQCERQTQLYSSMMSGLMDARGAIINNNMNVLLKNLTLINVVFLPLNLIAGIGGMSEFSRMTENVSWWISYPAFMVTLSIFGWLLWIILVRINQPGKAVGFKR